MSMKGRSSRHTSHSCARADSRILPPAPGAVRNRWARTIAMRSPKLLRHAWAVASKDLLVEFRSRTAILSAAVFVVLVLVVFNFGRDPTAISNVDLAPSILWVTFTFAAILALNRAFQLELENQALDGLLIAPIALATVGFVAVGTLFSAMTVRTRFAELLLPVLLLPFMIPPLSWAVLATGRLFAGRPLSEIAGWLNMLAVYDIVFVTLALLLFPATVNE